MTGPPAAGEAPSGGPQLWVRGVDEAGTELVHRPLPHGTSPQQLLADAGYASRGARAVAGSSDPHRLVLEFMVRGEPGIRMPARPPLRDPDLVTGPGEQPRRRQRVAAYALCRSERGLLLTQLSERTNVPGMWGLPGGGMDPRELPEQTVHREVFEETGQRLRVERFLGVHDAHWLGRAPSGRLEDFHAVRLVYLASCPSPGEPVVNDVGGTTRSAAWVPLPRLDALPLTQVWREVLDAWLPALS